VSNPRFLRLGLLLALYATNPLTYAWATTTGGSFPDSVGYLLLAKALLADGALQLTGYGHVDNGVILPPLYPFLIGLASLVHDDPVLVSQWLSGVLMLAAVVPVFLWVERATNAWLAAAAVAATQWQPAYLLYGTSTLTEPLFVLGACSIGYALTRLLERAEPSRRDWLLLGAALFLMFLVRHLAVLLLPVTVGIVLAVRLLQGRRGAIALARPAALMVAGYAALALPYAATVYAQSGQPPWVQHYRLHQYVVREPAPTLAPAENYLELLIQRRQLRRLNAAGTEMLGELLPPGAGVGGKSLGEWLAAPAQWFENLRANLAHAQRQLGPACLGLAGLGMLLGLRRRTAPEFTARATLTGLLGGYLLLLPLVTGLVARYVEVLAPLLIGVACVGVHGLADLVPRRKAPAAWIAIAAVATAAFLLPVFASAPAPRLHKYGVQHSPLAGCRELVTPGAGVFAFHPMQPYLVGGYYRVTPNDSLDRIAAYGRRTGTRWLLFHADASTEDQALLYDNAPWMQDPGELFRNANYVPRCGSADGRAVLLEIGPEPAPRAPAR
jgi:hypothetical protein